MKVKQFLYSHDNLSYVISHHKHAVIIDGGAVDDIVSYISDQGISQIFITNTHSHFDHTIGNKQLLHATNATYLDHTQFSDMDHIRLGDKQLEIFQTPGHTQDSYTFVGDSFMITGDTLFNGTVGNCFSGNVMGFLSSLDRLTKRSPNTFIYAGHDYVKQAIKYAKKIEPTNIHLDRYLSSYSSHHVYSTLEIEYLINPFLRLNEPFIISLLEQNKLPIATRVERFNALKSIEIW